MKAIVLAAGRGTRLRPITADKPKPLVELGNRPLLATQLDVLEEAGVEDITLVGGYRAADLSEMGYDVVVNGEYAETDMVYSLFCAVDEFPEAEDLLICYGDILYEPAVVAAIAESNASISVVVDDEWRDLWEARFDDPLDDAETLSISNDRIRDIGGEPAEYAEIDGQYVGLVKIRSDRIDAFTDAYEELRRQSADHATIHMTRFLQALIDDGWDIQPVHIDGGWLEIDTISDLNLYNDLLEAGDLDTFLDLPDRFLTRTDIES